MNKKTHGSKQHLHFSCSPQAANLSGGVPAPPLTLVFLIPFSSVVDPTRAESTWRGTAPLLTEAALQPPAPRTFP